MMTKSVSEYEIEDIGSAVKESEEKWMISDWTGTIKFGKFFDSFDDAEEFLSQQLGDTYETDRGEFDILQGESRDSRYLDPTDPRSGEVAVWIK